MPPNEYTYIYIRLSSVVVVSKGISHNGIYTVSYFKRTVGNDNLMGVSMLEKHKLGIYRQCVPPTRGGAL